VRLSNLAIVLTGAIKQGLEFFSHSPATAIKDAQDGTWLVETPKGTIKATVSLLVEIVVLLSCRQTVIHCTNGYAETLLPELKNVVVPTRGHVTAVFSADDSKAFTETQIHRWEEDYGTYMIQASFLAFTIRR
jgi:glycine/D-amino acid oxidase-like deaminating enzyme